MKPAFLALADGSVFHGQALGAAGLAVGELVFNTAMSGYQEILTDPSYCKQIVTLTYPHIGNVGTNAEDEESARVWASGLVVRHVPHRYANWRATHSLSEYLQAREVVAIAGLDTRRITRLLRSHGAQAACLAAGDVEPAAAIAAARDFPGLKGMDLAGEVTTSAAYEWTEGVWRLAQQPRRQAAGRWHVVAIDFGVKRNILRMLAERDCRITVVPARTPASDILAMGPDGVFLANGPGDPAPCAYAIETIQALVEARLPLFGICLGHQLLSLALGAQTKKMKFGHHGANHPVQDLATGRVMITSQNHGFAVDEASLPANLVATHRSLFDGTLQGVRCTDRPAFAFQGHPEASPGPHDVQPLFDAFVRLMQEQPANH